MPANKRKPALPKLRIAELSDADPRALDADLERGFNLALAAGWRRGASSTGSHRVYAAGVRCLLKWTAARGLGHAGAVSAAEVQQWWLWARGRYQPATLGVYLIGVRAFCAWLVEQGERLDDPTVGLSAPRIIDRVTEPFSPAEWRALLRALDTGSLTGARNVALFTFLLDTGLRRAEALAVRVADIDWKGRRLKVVGKGRRERFVGVSATTLRTIDTYLRRRGRELGERPELWHSRQGHGAYTAAALASLCERLTRDLGFHVHPHRLRHSFAQSALDAGMDRDSVQTLLGHSSALMTKRYTRATDSRRALEQHQRFSPVEQMRRGKG